YTKEIDKSQPFSQYAKIILRCAKKIAQFYENLRAAGDTKYGYSFPSWVRSIRFVLRAVTG
ncbi:MAG: hypothetical protein J6B77_10000, partial [Clostridia bacterium]|nr:hypothetical protein [Clostridia bacterium]